MLAGFECATEWSKDSALNCKTEGTLDAADSIDGEYGSCSATERKNIANFEVSSYEPH